MAKEQPEVVPPPRTEPEKPGGPEITPAPDRTLPPSLPPEQKPGVIPEAPPRKL